MTRNGSQAPRRLLSRKAGAENGGIRTRGQGFGLSLPVLGILGLVLLCAVVWAFVMGFLVGRGHNPETHLREMTGFTREDSAPRPEPEQAPELAESGQEQLAQPAVEQQAAPLPKAPSFPEPSDQALAAWGEGPAAKQASQPEEPKKRPQKEPAQEKPVQYEYSYQLAAFKTAAEAENIRKKIQGRAIRVQVRKSGKVYLALASFRGAAKMEQELLDKMKALKLGKPLLLSRKPLGNPSAKKGKK